jgi:lysophospholipase L1-like esterase
MADFNPTAMPVTPRHGIKYPGANDLVKYASQQFKAMAESIDDNIDRMPAEITKRVDEAATTASAAATRAEAAAAKAGTLADQNMADNITAPDTKTGAALDQWRRRGNRYHNAVIIGDSLSKGYYDGKEHDGQGIGENICSMLGVTTVQNLAVSGSGYTVGGTNTFPKQWDRAANKSDVDLVLVIGGVNDNNTDCSAAVTQLLNSIATDAPEAVTYVFPVAGGLGLGIHNRMTCLHSINTAALALTATTNGRGRPHPHETGRIPDMGEHRRQAHPHRPEHLLARIQPRPEIRRTRGHIHLRPGTGRQAHRAERHRHPYHPRPLRPHRGYRLWALRERPLFHVRRRTEVHPHQHGD